MGLRSCHCTFFVPLFGYGWRHGARRGWRARQDSLSVGRPVEMRERLFDDVSPQAFPIDLHYVRSYVVRRRAIARASRHRRGRPERRGRTAPTLPEHESANEEELVTRCVR